MRLYTEFHFPRQSVSAVNVCGGVAQGRYMDRPMLVISFLPSQGFGFGFDLGKAEQLIPVLQTDKQTESLLEVVST